MRCVQQRGETIYSVDDELFFSVGTTLYITATNSAQSELGRGATFCIYLPIVAGAVEDCAPIPVEELRGHGQRVLLVDDDAAVRNLIGEVPRFMGFDVIEAYDRVFAADCDNIDLIFPTW